MRSAHIFVSVILFSASAAGENSKNGNAQPTSPPAATEVREAHRKLLKRLLAKAGAEQAELVVVERTPEQQTRLMYELAREDRQHALDTYCKAGDAVIETFDPKLDEAQNLARMQAELIRQLPYARELGCLNHVRNDDVYAVDVAEDQVPHPEVLIEVALRAVKAHQLDRFLAPNVHPHAFHFELSRRGVASPAPGAAVPP